MARPNIRDMRPTWTPFLLKGVWGSEAYVSSKKGSQDVEVQGYPVDRGFVNDSSVSKKLLC